MPGNETPHQAEQRLRQVEEAIIEFRHIAKTVIVRHDEDIRDLQSDVENLKTSIYQSCDTKTKEIDDKVKDARNFVLGWLSVAVFAGLSATTYFTVQLFSLQSDVAVIKNIQTMRNDQIKDIQTDIKTLIGHVAKEEKEKK